MNDADQILTQIAQAFEQKDLKTIEELISDPYSAMAFSSRWADKDWQAFANDFKLAKLKNSSDTERVYQIPVTGTNAGRFEGKDIDIRMFVNNDKKWILDFSNIMVVPTRY